MICTLKAEIYGGEILIVLHITVPCFLGVNREECFIFFNNSEPKIVICAIQHPVNICPKITTLHASMASRYTW